MLRRQGSHFAPMGKGWLLAVGLVAVAGGAAVAGGLRGGPDGGRVQLRTVTTTAPASPDDVEPSTTTTTGADVADEGVAADGTGPSRERARGVVPSTVRTTRPLSRATTTHLTTTTVDPDIAKDAAEEEEERREDEQRAAEEAAEDAARQQNP